MATRIGLSADNKHVLALPYRILPKSSLAVQDRVPGFYFARRVLVFLRPPPRPFVPRPISFASARRFSV